MDDQQRGMALMAAGYGFGGAGLVAPKLVASVFGLSDASDEYLALMRLLAIRNVALAEAFRAVSDDDKRRKHFFTVAAAMFSADTVATVLSAAKGRVTWKSAIRLGITTAALAAVAATGVASS